MLMRPSKPLNISNQFNRDRLTWMAYAMLAYVGFNQAILGPIMPSLRIDLGLSYTQGGYLSGALALGLIVSGLISDRIAHYLGRRVIFWSGGIGLAVGVVLLGLSHRFEMVIIAVLGLGFFSSLAQVIIQALLADHHGERRSIALTEANVGASLSTTITPLVISGMQRLNIDWRGIMFFTVILLLSVILPFHRQVIPNPVQTQIKSGAGGGRLPFSFWMFWGVLFLIVSVEMSLAVWATDFLASSVGLNRADAVLAFGAFSAAMLTGRFTGSRLAHRWSTRTLLNVSLGLTLLAFPIFVYARIPALNILGLFLSGLGIANLYPSTLSMAVGLVGEKTNQASARASLAVGAALLIAPLILGWFADRLGIRNAYGIVILVILAAICAVISSRFVMERRKEPHH